MNDPIDRQYYRRRKVILTSAKAYIQPFLTGRQTTQKLNASKLSHNEGYHL